MKRYILTKEQLREYVENKKAEKVFYSIVADFHRNKKFLNENIDHNKVNTAILNDYKRKSLLTPRVVEMLIKHKVISENHEITL